MSLILMHSAEHSGGGGVGRERHGMHGLYLEDGDRRLF